MRNMFESPEIFEAYATIDAGYYMLTQLMVKIENEKPTTPIAAMVDKATGHDATKTRLYYIEAKNCIEAIIEAKKIIETDHSRDDKILAEIQTFI